MPFANAKLGGGAPPLRTDAGWLILYHAVGDNPGRGKNGWEEKWTTRYTIGAMLLDRENPRKKIAVATDPLMVPEAQYQTEGSFRTEQPTPWNA